MRKFLFAFIALTCQLHSMAQVPANDECINAIPLDINGDTVMFSNTGTVTDAANPTCGGTNAIKDVWFSFIYTGGNISITTHLTGTLTDTRMALYSSCGGPQIVCNDDFGGTYASQINIGCPTLTLGTTYYLQVGGYQSLTGTFGLSIVSTAVVGCTDPNASNFNACATIDGNNCLITNANDACDNAVLLLPNSGAVNTTNIDASSGATPGCGGAIKDVWFKFVYQGGNYTLTLGASTATDTTQLVDTQMAVYESCGGSIIACDDDDAAGNYSMIRFGCPQGNGTGGAFEDDQLEIGHTYYVQVGGYNNTEGLFSIHLTTATVAGCTDPDASNYNTCATQDNGTCEFPPIAANFYYNVVSNNNNCYTIQYNNSSEGNQVSHQWTFDGSVDVFNSSDENPVVTYPGPGVFAATLVVTDPMGISSSITQNIIVTEAQILTIDVTADNLPQQTTWKVFNAENVLVAQGTTNDATLCIANECHRVEFYDTGNNGICCTNGNGGFNIFLNGVSVATGGAFGNYTFIEVNCAQGSTCEDPIIATLDTLVVPAPNTWYAFTPSVNGQYRISTCGLANCNTTIWMYDYCNMANFDESNAATYTYNDDFCGEQAEITPYLEGGITYYVRVGDHNNDCGTNGYQVSFEYMGPIQGCMDELACNYSPLAEMPATCYYNGDPNCNNLGPDLSVDGNLLYTSMYQTTINGTDACLVNEGCLQGLGNREIIRFSTRIDNIGNQDYFIGVPNTANDQFVWDLCHNHYHYAGYAEYELYDAAGNLMPEVGFKNGFCVLDLGCVTGVAKFGCGNMGITAGCYDVYNAGLQCQWVDVTDVPAGTYHLVLKTNWDHDPDMLGHYELAYNNNWAQVCFSFERDSLDQLINFQKLPMSACGILTDCLGQPFGNAQPDCQGNCPGQVKRGDIATDLMYDLGDIYAYGNASVAQNLGATDCNDLNEDGVVSIADAAYLDQCIHTQQDQGILPGLMEPCAWDPEIVDVSETATLSIGNLNTNEGYFDVMITNPDGMVNAMQFDISGATIMSVESLLPNTTWSSYLFFEDEGTKIAALGHLGTMIPVNFSALPVLRVHYANITNNEICIGNIDEIINVFMHNILTQVGPCVPVSEMINNPIYTEANCVSSPVVFTDNSFGNTNRTWYFPGGTPATSNAAEVAVQYAATGTYSFALVISDGNYSDSIWYENAIQVSEAVTYFQDNDGDGEGSDVTISACSLPSGYVSNSNDCDDFDNNIATNAVELCNNYDDNCNNAIDEGFDQDNDGYSSCMGDCDDNSAIAHPQAMELCNLVDDNCNSIVDEGFDNDGDGFTLCNGDCNDNFAGINPSITETCNGLDDNCDGLADEGLTTPWYNDIDEDGYGAGVASYFCIQPVGMVTNNVDCDDSDPTLNPAAVEVLDNTDNDCDGFVDEGAVNSVYDLDQVQLTIMPNPASSQVVIYTNAHIGNVQVKVFDQQGKQVDQFQYTGQRTEINVSSWANGVYQLVFQTANGYGMKRLVVGR